MHAFCHEKTSLTLGGCFTPLALGGYDYDPVRWVLSGELQPRAWRFESWPSRSLRPILPHQSRPSGTAAPGGLFFSAWKRPGASRTREPNFLAHRTDRRPDHGRAGAGAPRRAQARGRAHDRDRQDGLCHAVEDSTTRKRYSKIKSGAWGPGGPRPCRRVSAGKRWSGVSASAATRRRWSGRAPFEAHRAVSRLFLDLRPKIAVTEDGRRAGRGFGSPEGHPLARLCEAKY